MTTFVLIHGAASDGWYWHLVVPELRARTEWPDVPTRFLLCRNDRFFPADFRRRVVKDRLGITPDEIESGHLPALSRPKELAERLDVYLARL